MIEVRRLIGKMSPADGEYLSASLMKPHIKLAETLTLEGSALVSRFERLRNQLRKPSCMGVHWCRVIFS